ncbi:AP-3 complex subunit mu-2 [Gonapodya sp. JEL0774]|nr:AP-3 complex subunit mu-2 [Gonapodya sp. JEL0774]
MAPPPPRQEMQRAAQILHPPSRSARELGGYISFSAATFGFWESCEGTVFPLLVPPLFVLQLLQRLGELMTEYFDGFTEAIVRDNAVIIYELLDEMLDAGFPVNTEPAVLRELVPPPSLLSQLVQAVNIGTNLPSVRPLPTLSNIPWRPTNIKYASNEVLFDIAEEIDVLMNSCVPHSQWSSHNGSIASGEIQGQINCLSKLSAKLELNLTQRTSGAKGLESVALIVLLPQSTGDIRTNVNVGQSKWDSLTKRLQWVVPKMSAEPGKGGIPQLSCTFSLQREDAKLAMVAIFADFRVQGQSVSGLRVDTLQLLNEPYKPYKGVKSSIKAGRYCMRLSA